MNNFKFRHYDTRLCELRYSNLHDGGFYVNTKGVMYMHTIPKSETGLDTDFYKSYDVDVFTGIQDSKGDDVYVNDIVYIAGFGNGVVEICPFYGVQICNSNGESRDASIALAEGDFGEVVGNIYENIDLIK